MAPDTYQPESTPAMTGSSVILPLELQLHILDTLLSLAIVSSLPLGRDPKANLQRSYSLFALLLTNKTYHAHLTRHPSFNRLRLFIFLNTLESLPHSSNLAVLDSSTDTWTLLKPSFRTETIGYDAHDRRGFLVLNETYHTEATRALFSRSVSGLSLNPPQQEAPQVPLFPFRGLVLDLLAYAAAGGRTVWLWKRSPAFFSAEKTRFLMGGDNEEGCGFKAYLRKGEEAAFMAWDPPGSQRDNTHDVLSHSSVMLWAIVSMF